MILPNSAYLDEIQDLSYAAIYLICTLAGKERLRWVCAGDPAQMISPGCSFTFDGLKQTLLAVKPGIEDRVKQVTHLLVNYRTTKDVLHLANEVLTVARKNFRGAIPFARREEAKKDLGFKVLLCDRKTAFQQKLKLGTNQAVVFSSTNPADAERIILNWIGSHPFVVSSLESKGLEFDDVIVFFDHDRTVWNVAGQSASSLRMLRELYVAITRAQRRVVILTSGSDSDMVKFFNSLDCEFQVEGAELVLSDFNKVTTPEEWFKKAQEHFFNEVYLLAARCFDIAGKSSWFHWSQGKHAETSGNYSTAWEEYILALKAFDAENDHENVVHVGLALAHPSIAKPSEWEKSYDTIVDEALKYSSKMLQKIDSSSKVRLALLRDAWESISIDHLKDQTLASLFIVYRGQQSLNALVAKGDDEDRLVVAEALPSVVGDYHKEKKEFAKASSLYLKLGTRGRSDAIEFTKLSMRENEEGTRLVELPGVCESWVHSTILPRDEYVELLLQLFKDPLNVPSTLARRMLTLLEKNPIITAVDHISGDRTQLKKFGCREFFKEISDALEDTYQKGRLEAARWFMDQNEEELGWQFLHECRSKLTDDEMCVAVQMSRPCRTWLLQETKQRHIFPLVCLRTLASQDLPESGKDTFLAVLSEFAIDFECSLVALVAWCFENYSGSNGSRKGKGGRKTKRGLHEKTLAPAKIVEPLSIFSRKLLAVWPRIAHSTAAEGHAFSGPEMKALLFFVYKRLNIQERTKFDKITSKDNDIRKACEVFVELWLGTSAADRDRSVCLSASVTTSFLNSKGLDSVQLFSLFQAWCLGTNCFEDSLPGAAILPTVKLALQVDDDIRAFEITRRALSRKNMTTKQHGAVLSFLSSNPSNISSAVHKGFSDVALMCTKSSLKECASTPGEAGEVLMTWLERCKKIVTIKNEVDLFSFLVLLADEVEVRQDHMASIVLRCFGPHVYRFTKMYFRTTSSSSSSRSSDTPFMAEIVKSHRALLDHVVSKHTILHNLHQNNEPTGKQPHKERNQGKSKGDKKKGSKKVQGDQKQPYQSSGMEQKNVPPSSYQQDDFAQRLRGWAQDEPINPGSSVATTGIPGLKSLADLQALIPHEAKEEYRRASRGASDESVQEQEDDEEEGNSGNNIDKDTQNPTHNKNNNNNKKNRKKCKRGRNNNKKKR